MMRLVFDSPVGHICLESRDGIHLAGLSFTHDEIEESDSDVLLLARRQLMEYFCGTRREFSVPISLEGTEFQKKVWNALLSIGYGETRSYGEIARGIGRAKAVRAVGGANHVNPIAIIVPCHRVIGSTGKLTGYAGGLDVKRFLLDLEGKSLKYQSFYTIEPN